MVRIQLYPNFEYLLTRPGIMKLMTLVFGILSVGFGLRGIEGSRYNDTASDKLENELYFEFVVVSVFTVSLFYLVLHCFSDELTYSRKNRVFDTIFHTASGKALLVAGILLISSAVHIESLCGQELFSSIIRKDKDCQLHDFKILGGTLALFDGLLYEITAYLAFTTKDLT